MSIPTTKEKLVVVLGLTASGKSDLAVSLAKKFNGEIISADSRQVYKDMDIGTGKVPRDQIRNSKFEIRNKLQIQNSIFKKQKVYFYKGIRHHLLDVASPKRDFNVVRYKKLAQKAIHNIEKREKLPNFITETKIKCIEVVCAVGPYFFHYRFCLCITVFW